ncbi:hypothetical protein [Pseudomonas putida]|uniref:hypothetical protein n=1 Tax=Pseudomonas putida TaxID=303 RepID=UPI0023673198|nr:hypothetical protein [Pseudomonas putida]MDD2046562.1 hypothetical protein [Pseudomonas putida]
MPQSAYQQPYIKDYSRVHFVSPGSDWASSRRACDAAQRVPASLERIKRLWRLYQSDSHSVGDYLGYLPYLYWTADQIGAGTAWVYDLNDSNVDKNADGKPESEICQVLGIDPA